MGCDTSCANVKADARDGDGDGDGDAVQDDLREQ